MGWLRTPPQWYILQKSIGPADIDRCIAVLNGIGIAFKWLKRHEGGFCASFNGDDKGLEIRFFRHRLQSGNGELLKGDKLKLRFHGSTNKALPLRLINDMCDTIATALEFTRVTRRRATTPALRAV